MTEGITLGTERGSWGLPVKPAMTTGVTRGTFVTLGTDRGSWGLPVEPAMTEGCPMGPGLTMGVTIGLTNGLSPAT